MTATQNPATPRQLSQAWRDWTEIVRLFAENGSARQQVQEKVYAEIHHKVAATLNGLAGQQQNATESFLIDFYDQLTALVQPWMSLSALRDADPRISQSLLVQCQRFQRDIDAQVESPGGPVCPTEPATEATLKKSEPPAQSRSAWGKVVVFSLLFVGMFALALGSEFWSDIRQSPLISNLVDGLGPAWSNATRDDGDVQFGLIKKVSIAVIALTAWAVFRPPKSY